MNGLYLTFVETSQKPTGNINIINNNIIINTRGNERDVLANLLNLLPQSNSTVNNPQSTSVQQQPNTQQSSEQSNAQQSNTQQSSTQQSNTQQLNTQQSSTQPQQSVSQPNVQQQNVNQNVQHDALDDPEMDEDLQLAIALSLSMG